MKIKFLTPLAGTNYSYKHGDVIHFADADPAAVAEAKRHIANGNARELDDVEVAMENARETAMLKRAKSAETATAPKPETAAPGAAAKKK